MRPVRFEGMSLFVIPRRQEQLELADPHRDHTLELGEPELSSERRQMRALSSRSQFAEFLQSDTDVSERRADVWERLRAQGHRIGLAMAKRGVHYVIVDNVALTLAEARDLASGRISLAEIAERRQD